MLIRRHDSCVRDAEKSKREQRLLRLEIIGKGDKTLHCVNYEALQRKLVSSVRVTLARPHSVCNLAPKDL